MDTNDVPISPVGVEDPKIHIISVNDVLINVAIELQLIVLVGASISSVNSEYRQFNLDVRVVNELKRGLVANKQVNAFFQKVKRAIDAKTKKQTISLDGIEMKNVAYDGIDYAIIYYLLIKKFGYTEEQFVTLNSFTTLIPFVKLFDKILSADKLHLNAVDLKSFADYAMKYGDNGYVVGSKLFCITRRQVENTTDLTQSIWKTMYINRIIRNLPVEQRKQFFSPSIGWGFIRCVAKHVFTNSNLIDQVSFGENINYIRSSSIKQNQVASQLILGQLYGNALEDIKHLTNELKKATIDVDYSLGDIVVVMFYRHMGDTLYNQLNAFIEDSKSMKKVDTHSMISRVATDYESFKQMIFQYLYSTFLLAKHGILHNDPHLNNILITKSFQSKSKIKTNFTLSPGKTISIDISDFDLTIIDYDKSILSHHHMNSFESTAKMINEEVGIVFDEVKKTIVSNYNQVFNCFAMYDIIRFGLIMKNMLDDINRIIGHLLPKKTIDIRNEFLDKMIKLAHDILYKIYDPNAKFPFDKNISQGSIEWLIMTLYKDYSKTNSTKSSILNATQIAKIQSSSMTDKPEFVSSRRKYADTLKYEFISQYASNINK